MVVDFVLKEEVVYVPAPIFGEANKGENRTNLKVLLLLAVLTRNCKINVSTHHVLIYCFRPKVDEVAYKTRVIITKCKHD